MVRKFRTHWKIYAQIASDGMSNEKSFGTSHIGSHTSLTKEICDSCKFNKNTSKLALRPCINEKGT